MRPAAGERPLPARGGAVSPELGSEPAVEAPAPRAGVPLQTRGAVQPGALYVTRAVDAAVVAALQAGQWTVVLGPRFSGRSSLRVRVAQALLVAPPELPQDGVPAPRRCAAIELRTLQAASSGAAYLLVCSTLATQLRLPAANGFWQRHSEEPPAERFRRFLCEEVASAELHTVILLDDLDALTTLPLDAAEFLGLLGQVQATLAAGEKGSLTVGAFSTVPLEQLAGHSGGWEARRFLLPDFTRLELAAFAPALAALWLDGGTTEEDWLEAIFAWTSGHPQLTQHVCQQLVARAPTGTDAAARALPEERVERLLRSLFLDQEDAVQEEPCLREMVQTLRRSPQAQALLSLYRRLLSGAPVTPDPLDELQRELRLCGLCREAEDAAGALRLRPRCRLIASLLGEDWAREQEVRILLQEAIDKETARETAREPAARTPSSGGPLLRGGALKTAQAWARKHPDALRPAEVRVLLASLEAARSEVESKHQSSAAALQRELREKTEGRLRTGLGRPASAVPPPRPAPQRSWVTIAAMALVLGASLVALASAYRRVARLEQASAQAAARAQHAEQALQQLRADRATQGPPPRAVAQNSASALRAPSPEAAAERPKPPPSKLTERRAQPPRNPAPVIGRELGNCPDPGRPTE